MGNFDETHKQASPTPEISQVDAGADTHKENQQCSCEESDTKNDLSRLSHGDIKLKIESRASIDIELRKYRIAVTDLFVETALELLKQKADIYQKRGNTSYLIGILVICFAILVAAIQALIPQDIIRHAVYHVANLPLPADDKSVGTTISLWIDFAGKFTRGFTFYGLLVLAAVKIWQFSRAMLDQSERLFERRHALRQGRLYIHLCDGKIGSVDEMDKAFGWNLDQPNAFANIVPDAKAPWGAAIAEITKITPDLVRIGAEAAAKASTNASSTKR